MYFIRNLETDKIELHSNKSEYEAMTPKQKEFIKSTFLFARSIPGWVSRCKIGGAWWLDTLKGWGIEDKGATGEKLSFGEKVELQKEKAQRRAEKMEHQAEKNEKLSNQHYNVATQMADMIPMGQPILVGHHSEKPHRRHLEKIHNNMDKSIEAGQKADYYRDRLAASIQTAEGKQFQNPAYLVNRIKECEARIRELNRMLEGKDFAHSQPKPIGEQRRTYLLGQLEEQTDKLDYMNYCLEQCRENGKAVYDRESLKGKKLVLIRGQWREIVRLNPTTIAVTNNSFPNPEAQRKYPLKYNYGEVRDAK